MNTKFAIGELVLIKETYKSVIVDDFELFDDIILYYTSDNSAYPQNNLSKLDFGWISLALETPEHIKNEEFDKLLPEI